jgi:hypothetical protein
MKGKITVLVIIVLAVLIGIYALMNITYKNREVRLSNLLESQVLVIEANYDKMWKILKQQAQVTDKYKDSFKDVYVGIMEGRYSEGGGTLMKWIQESNPQFDSSLYKTLMTSIESNRTDFFNEQKKLISMSNQHKDLLQVFPGSFFLAGIENIEITIISSSKTKEVMKTGIDDVSLF